MKKLIDFSECENGYRDYGGSDNKLSIEYENEKYMLKLPEKRVKTNELQTSHVNNVLSEYLGSHIIGTLGLIPSYHQIYDVIERQPLLSNIRGISMQRYWETFVADALIGNFDRHKGNWGYLVNESTKDVKLAPIYDCGSCLYPGLAEKAMEQVLGSREEIEMRMYQFPKAALNWNEHSSKEDKVGYFEMLSSGRDKNCNIAFLKIYPRIDMDKIYRVVSDTPLLSDTRIDFYNQMLGYRKELILDKAYEILLDKFREETTKRKDGELSIIEAPINSSQIIQDLIRYNEQALIIIKMNNPVPKKFKRSFIV